MRRALPLLCLVLACNGDDESTTTFTAATYNGGLAVGFVKAAHARAPLVADAVRALEADVVCVQEFWQPEHVDLLDAPGSAFANSVFLDPDPGTIGPAACTDADLMDLQTCAETNGCPMVCEDELVNCVLDNCLAEFTAVPAGCNACLQANVGKSYEDVIASCKSQSTEYAFGGAFGIGLLSRHAFVQQDTLVFESTTNRRAVIYGQIATDIGTVHAFCTHLTAVFASIPFPDPMGSWEAEQAAQIDRMLAYVDEKTGGSGLVVLMGDMNTGPAGDTHVAEVEQNYQKFLAAGFANPYIATPGHPCTFCADNPIVAEGSDDSASVVIDHVLLRGQDPSAQASGVRILDQGITVDNCNMQIATAYSDHYGVSVTLTQ
jgi:endonuclease/exonuclease/phosphatase family metal-dependent hydrolase